MVPTLLQSKQAELAKTCLFFKLLLTEALKGMLIQIVCPLGQQRRQRGSGEERRATAISRVRLEFATSEGRVFDEFSL